MQENIFKSISRFKNNTAIITNENEKISYQKIIDLTDKFSILIKKRCLIFLISSTNVESLISYLSFYRSNNVISILNERINNQYLELLIKNYLPQYIFVKKNKFLKINGYTLVFTFYNYNLLKLKEETPYKLNDELSLLISTSGSTGTPKFVRQSYDNLLQNTNSIVNFLNIKEDDKTILNLPMSYVYGLSLINTHLNSGSSIVLNNHSVIKKSFWDAVQLNKVTNINGVPYIYEMISRINLRNFDLKSLKFFTQAGGKLNINIIDKFIKYSRKNNKKFIIMYGAAEATARMSYLPWNSIDEKKLSAGLAINKGKFWIEDENNKKINSYNVTGNLIYKGSNVCLGYAYSYNDLYKGDENLGKLKTGDMARIDKDGFIYLEGRKDRFVKIYGNRVNLEEIEEIIFNYGIQSVCKVMIENKINIYIKEKKKILVKDFQNFLFQKTNLHPSTFVVKMIKELPLNTNLKIDLNKNLDV